MDRLPSERLNDISIHAPREGGDQTARLRYTMNKHFNPRPPRGGATGGVVRIQIREVISIHAPARGATRLICPSQSTITISIHAPREGGDGFVGFNMIEICDFNPRPPRGGD